MSPVVDAVGSSRALVATPTTTPNKQYKNSSICLHYLPLEILILIYGQLPLYSLKRLERLHPNFTGASFHIQELYLYYRHSFKESSLEPLHDKYPNLKTIVDKTYETHYCKPLFDWSRFTGHPRLESVTLYSDGPLPLGLIDCPNLKMLEFATTKSYELSSHESVEVLIKLMSRLRCLHISSSFSTFTESLGVQLREHLRSYREQRDAEPMVASNLIRLCLELEGCSFFVLTSLLDTFSFPNVTTLTLTGFKGLREGFIHILTKISQQFVSLQELSLKLYSMHSNPWLICLPTQITTLDIDLSLSTGHISLQFLSRLSNLKSATFCFSDLQTVRLEMPTVPIPSLIDLTIKGKEVMFHFWSYFPNLKSLDCYHLGVTNGRTFMSQLSQYCPFLERVELSMVHLQVHMDLSLDHLFPNLTYLRLSVSSQVKISIFPWLSAHDKLKYIHVTCRCFQMEVDTHIPTPGPRHLDKLEFYTVDANELCTSYLKNLVQAWNPKEWSITS